MLLFSLHFILRRRHFRITVEPLSNDHPHQRPSLLYDHILCDGHCFLFLRSLTNDHPSDATNDRVRWDCLPRERPPRLQCISKNRGWRFNQRSCNIRLATRPESVPATDAPPTRVDAHRCWHYGPRKKISRRVPTESLSSLVG